MTNRTLLRTAILLATTLGVLAFTGSASALYQMAGVAAPAATCATPNTLAGSNFEIDTNANLKVDGASPCIDWLTGGTGSSLRPDVSAKSDKPTGANDDSFGQGTKEDTAVPTVVSGSIPNNKSDLKNFGVLVEKNASGKFLELFWSRVQNPSGTTNMDFELNQSSAPSANGVTPARTIGDRLITYDLDRGGTVPTISINTWQGSAWGPPTVLTNTGDALGSVNTSALAAADTGGLGAQDAFTFGEASISFAALFGGGGSSCTGFGSAYLKSRSSSSFTSEVKDFIAPEAVRIATCDLTLTKSASPTTYDHAGQIINYTYVVTNSGEAKLAGPVTVTDDKTTVTCPNVNTVGNNDGFLDPNESITCTATYTITQADMNSGSVTNHAVAHAGGTDSNQATTTVTAQQNPALALLKTATSHFSSPPVPGDKITYSFKLTNSGNVTLTSVQLTDALVGFTNATCGTGGGTLAPGAFTTCSADYTISQADIDAGHRFNTATACGTPPTGSNVCDTKTTDTPITQTPALALLKTATSHFSSPPVPGDKITYSFKLTNSGNVTLTSVQLTDALVGFTNATCGTGGGTLAPGAFTTCSADYTISQADIDAGHRFNTATACGTPPTGSNVCDTKTTDTPITQTPALALLKTATSHFSSPPVPGDKITYSFKLTNSGNVTLTSVQLTDALVGFTNATCGTGGGTLAPGAFTTCSADYTISQADIDAGHRFNTATACGTPPTGSNVCDTKTTDTPITQTPALALLKTATSHFSSPPVPGDKITYSFKLTNSGNVTLTSVQLTDALVGFTNATCGTGGGTLAPGAFTTCSADYTISQADIDAGHRFNTATACGTPPTGSNVCDTKTTDTPITQTPALALLKTATSHFSSPPVPGDKITYSFKLTNSGNVTLTSVQLTDALVGFTNATCGTGGGTLAPGAFTTCSADYTISQADIDAGHRFNTATACGTPPTGSNVCDTKTTDTPITQTPALALLKTATSHFSSPPVPGDKITYSFKLTNSGNVTLTSVQLTDALVGFTNATCGTGGGTLAPGAFTTCSADYTISQADIDAGHRFNTATACGTPPTGSNVCDTKTTDTPITQTPALALLKTATSHFSSPPVPGDKITYSFKLTNSGNVTLTSVQLTDALVGFTNATCGTGGGTLAPGAFTTCSADYTISQADIDAGHRFNTATACGTPPTGSNVCDTKTTDTPITQTPALALLKTATSHFSSPPVPGDKITYSFKLTNSGNVTLTSVQLTDALVGFTNATCGTGGGTLAPGAFTTCSADYTISQADIDAGHRFNTATACGTPPTGSNVCDTKTTDTPIQRTPAVDTGQKVVISDSAKPAGFGTPTGTVTFSLFMTSDCSGIELFGPVTKNLATDGVSGVVRVDNPTPLKTNGTYYWLVSYSGDANNLPSTSCGDEQTTISGNTTGIVP